MRLNEFEKDARRNVAERHRVQEQQLDEIIPAIGAAAGALARGAAAVGGGIARKAAGALAKGAAKAAGRSIAGAAKSTARGANKVSKSLANRTTSNDDPPETNDPNATVGTQTSTQTTQGTQGTQGTSSTKKSTDQSDPIKKGKSVKLPAGKAGLPKRFKVTRVQGDDVELENPLPKPGEPKRFVYNKDDIASNLK